MSLAFHACPPPGTWMNDPNALLRTANGWRLLAQYRDDAPDFACTHWGAWESADLARWRFTGVSLPGGADGWAYSGCVIAGASGTEALHTLHDPVTRHERQVRRAATPGGWGAAEPILGEAARNRRDPFAWARPGGGWGLLLARPGDWTMANEQGEVEIWTSPDARAWTQAGRIGPFSPPGVMWEVPLLIEHGGGRATFIVSTVDRRADRSDCAVRAWDGVFDGTSFTPDDADGRLLDLGPDFYAMTMGAERLAIGWLSSWRTARRFPWPGFTGGPASLPRRFDCASTGAGLLPAAELIGGFGRSVDAPPIAGLGIAEVGTAFTLCIGSAAGEVVLRTRDGVIEAERRAPGLDWQAAHRWTGHGALRLFVDGPAIELFVGEAPPLSVALPDAGAAFRIALEDGAGRAATIAWRRWG